MVWVPGLERHNIPPGINDPAVKPRIIVLHVMEGSIQSADRRFHDGEGIEAHIGIPKIGVPWQWRDTDYQADAQSAGNDYCISIETEGFASEAMTISQVNWLCKIGQFLMQQYQIPARIVAATSERGWGYHRQFESWNPNHHSCPGDIRIGQLQSIVVPRLIGGNLLSVTIDQLSAALRDQTRDLDHDDPKEPGNTHNHKVLDDKLDVIIGKLDTITGLLQGTQP